MVLVLRQAWGGGLEFLPAVEQFVHALAGVLPLHARGVGSGDRFGFFDDGRACLASFFASLFVLLLLLCVGNLCAFFEFGQRGFESVQVTNDERVCECFALFDGCLANGLTVCTGLETFV